MTTDRELWWAAGFWDGEGSSGCYGFEGRKRMYIQIDQHFSPETLIRFQNAMAGAGHVYGPTRARSGQLRWLYRVHGLDEVLRAAERLIPRVSGPKREQLKATIEAYCEDRGVELPKFLGGEPLTA